MKTETENAANLETINPKPAAKKSRTAKPKPETGYQSFTRGDRAYTVSPAVLSQIKSVYSFIFNFLSAEKYDAAREIKLFISHNLIDTKTNKKTRVQTFVTFPGTNKTKTFPKPKQLTFSIADAIKTFPALKPINQLIDATLYVTVSSKTDFRFYVSFKN